MRKLGPESPPEKSPDVSLPADTAAKTRDFSEAVRQFSAMNPDQAAAVCRDILSVTPNHAPALHLLGIITAEQGRLAEGLQLVEQALALEPRNSTFHLNRGLILVRSGNPATALEAFRQSAQLDPHDPRVPRQWVLALLACRRLAEAEKVARNALEAWPASAELLDTLGMVLMAQGLPDDARAVLEQACEIAPDYPDAYGNLAILLEQHNDLDAALSIIERGLKRWPEHRTLRFIKARCLRRRGRYAEAEPLLRDMLQSGLTDKLHLDIEFELGWCADGVDDVQGAIQHFTRANLLAEKLPAFQAAQDSDYLSMLSGLQQRFDRSWVEGWRSLPNADDGKDPVFIIGFPRTGTTLLDTMLGAHPEFRVLEEQPTVQAMLSHLVMHADGYPEGLAALTAPQQMELRHLYFQTAGTDTLGPAQGRLLDKSPFNTAHVGLIHRVFPQAQLVFVTRHPCDVCLSCFMNNFDLNSGTQYFTRLETTVALYCRMMALWSAYADTLPLRYQLVRYEDLVSETEDELRRLLSALGVAWSDNVLEHAEHAAKRKHIPTPSYAQVHRPVYQEARDRWQRYTDFLKPFLKDLQPYIELFGYV